MRAQNQRKVNYFCVHLPTPTLLGFDQSSAFCDPTPKERRRPNQPDRRNSRLKNHRSKVRSLHSDNSYVRVAGYLMLIKVMTLSIYDGCNQEA
jgi:hypothetical protein